MENDVMSNFFLNARIRDWNNIGFYSIHKPSEKGCMRVVLTVQYSAAFDSIGFSIWDIKASRSHKVLIAKSILRQYVSNGGLIFCARQTTIASNLGGERNALFVMYK